MPDESKRDLMPVQNMKQAPVHQAVKAAVKAPTNDDIITSTFTHVLSAFAIAEAQQDIFLRIETYLIQKDYELPKLNGIYKRQNFEDVRSGKTSYLSLLFSHAL